MTPSPKAMRWISTSHAEGPLSFKVQLLLPSARRCRAMLGASSARSVSTSVLQQGQRMDGHVDAFRAGQLRAGSGPVRVAHAHVLRADDGARHVAAPARFRLQPLLPFDLQITADDEAAARAFRHLLVDVGAGAVPVEGQHKDDHDGDQGEQGGQAPAEDFQRVSSVS